MTKASERRYLLTVLGGGPGETLGWQEMCDLVDALILAGNQGFARDRTRTLAARLRRVMGTDWTTDDARRAAGTEKVVPGLHVAVCMVCDFARAIDFAKSRREARETAQQFAEKHAHETGHGVWIGVGTLRIRDGKRTVEAAPGPGVAGEVSG